MNWLQFFQDQNVEFTTTGKNTSRGWVSVKCPWCGNDPSKHLGINLTTNGYSCWRDASHKGTKPVWLVSELLSCSQAQAKQLVDLYTVADPDDFNVSVGFKTTPEGILTVALPDEFKAIKKGTVTHKFWEYLYEREFIPVDMCISAFDLCCSLTGAYKGRLIIPVYHNGRLVGWQGRAIKDTEVRYKTSSPSVKKVLYNIDYRDKADTLIICEGPFDALKLDFYGANLGFKACCLFGVIPTHEQIYELMKVRQNYKRLVLLFDNDEAATVASFNLMDWLPSLEVWSLPEGIKDPGSMTSKQVRGYLTCQQYYP
jgi:hypothetical protein